MPLWYPVGARLAVVDRSDLDDTRRVIAMRELWLLCETVHAVVYFAEERVELYKAAGLKGGWMGYFAGRAAPMGAVGADEVTACFYNFHPAMVARAIPDAWTFSTPAQVLEARHSAVEQALRRALAGSHEEEVVSAAAIMREALADLHVHDRPLAAANASLPWPDSPELSLWHGCTVWREYRGDGHVAVLRQNGVGPIEAHLLAAAAGASTEDNLRTNRGWSDEEWSAARARMHERGLLGGGGLTDAGRELKRAIEARTDELSAAPWERLGPDRTERLVGELHHLAKAVIDAGIIPFPNPMGLDRAELEAVLSG